MKKVILSIGALVAMVIGAQAQTGYGLKAGINLPKPKVETAVGNINTSSTTNFYITGYANIYAGQNFAIQPGISLQGKGGKAEIADIENSTSLMSIEIPVNAVYYVPTGTSGSFFLGAGPYVGFNIAGQNKVGDTKTDIKFGSDIDETKVVDYGANFQAGYKFSNGFLINAGYGLGLANLSNLDGLEAKNRVLSFGIGFEF